MCNNKHTNTIFPFYTYNAIQYNTIQYEDSVYSNTMKFSMKPFDTKLVKRSTIIQYCTISGSAIYTA